MKEVFTFVNEHEFFACVCLQGVKRARSPSPPVVQLYPQNPVHSSHYPQGPYGQPQTTHSPYRQQGRT